MKYTVILEVEGQKFNFVKEFLKNISFIKKVYTAESNEITNPKVLKSIEDYESGNQKPSPMSLEELKNWMVDA